MAHLIPAQGIGLFEWFLPLMTITGHLLDYNRIKNNPVLTSAGLDYVEFSRTPNLT